MRKIRSEQERCRESVPSLLQWYAYNARVLPWREDPDPYHVWISEIMLQQTRVEAVRGYYARFLEAFPTIRDVAAASEDRLTKLWEGLGYYSRVRNIGKAARELCERYDGSLPADHTLLRSLPGIGDYTAGAIASIAFGIPVPAVDGNVLRVYARLLGSREDIRTDKFKKRIRGLLSTAMEEAFSETGKEENDGTTISEATGEPFPKMIDSRTGGAGQFNQAVMDIGATVCIPNGRPHCDVCPLSHLCVAFAEDLTSEIPMKAEKKARPTERKTVLVICSGDRVLLHRRPKKGLLAGMWEFPNVPGFLTPTAAKKAAADVLQGIGKATLMRAHRLDDYRHVFSHVEWEMRGYRIEAGNVRPGETESALAVDVSDEAQLERDGEYVWATEDELREQYGLPGAFRFYKA